MDRAALLLNLAAHGIDATVIGGTEVAGRRAWTDQTSAGQLRRDLALLTLVLGVEAGRALELPTAAMLPVGVRTAASRAAARSRAAATLLPPVVLRADPATGRLFRVVDVLHADPALPKPASQARIFQNWLQRLRSRIGLRRRSS